MQFPHLKWDKSTKISIMLAIDVVFFIVELGTGFWVHSLALMADAFHMLNDIISLVIGLWAVKAAKNPSTDRYSYGWLRAEILGAFFNAVFLIALCVSIILEAITRLVEPPEITNPELILIVGCFGLASNLVGFLVLGGHGHDHGHGGHDHDHDHAAHDHEHAHAKASRDPVSAAEEGRGADFADDNGPAMDVLPHVALARAQAEASSSVAQQKTLRAAGKASGSKTRERRRAGSTKHSRLTSIDDLSIHPSSFRQEILEHSLSNPHLPEPDSEDDTTHSQISEESYDESSALIRNGDGKNNGTVGKSKHSHSHSRSHSHSGRSRRDSGVHTEHNHNKPKDKKKTSIGHDHGDMGMNAMVLHVIGDALGNVGVIITALIIWLTDLPGKFYADPAVSLFITAIILRSAIPLTKATSKVLLQATPDHIDLRDIKDDIQNLPGVISCHHVHIWQLSDTKVVASMHVQLEFPITEDGGEKYMKLARQARKCLHAYGIHSATIQPEFCVDESCKHSDDGRGPTSVVGEAPQVKCGAVEGVGDPDSCLLECVDNCVGDGCCPTSKSKNGSRRSSSSGTAHDHDHSSHDGHNHGHSHDH